MVNSSSLGRTQRTGIELAIRVLRHPGTAIGVAVDRVGALTYDSRESLRSQEQQLAGRGVSWAMDPAYDVELAGELAAVRRRRDVRGSGDNQRRDRDLVAADLRLPVKGAEAGVESR